MQLQPPPVRNFHTVLGTPRTLKHTLLPLAAVYHWGVDNYGDGSTPVFGRQIAAFQGHHQRPWTITQREFANNLHQVCLSTRTCASAWG